MGIVVASTLHIIADKVNTRRKKMMRRNAEDKVNELGKGPCKLQGALSNICLKLSFQHFNSFYNVPDEVV